MNKTEIEIGERILSFEKAETNHYQVASPNNSPGLNFYIAHSLHKLSSCLFVRRDNFRECATLDAAYKKIFKLHFYWIKIGEFCKKNSFIREDAAFCFLVYFGFIYSSSLCHATWLSSAVRHSFLKELAIAKTATYIWTWLRSANSFTAISIINNSGTWFGLYVIRESN